jgi:hypothetical protein
MNLDHFQCLWNLAAIQFGLSELVHQLKATIAAEGVFTARFGCQLHEICQLICIEFHISIP